MELLNGLVLLGLFRYAAADSKVTSHRSEYDNILRQSEMPSLIYCWPSRKEGVVSGAKDYKLTKIKQYLSARKINWLLDLLPQHAGYSQITKTFQYTPSPSVAI